MKKFSYPFLALFFIFAPTVHINGAATTPLYFDPAMINFKSLLPNPPAVGSPDALKEIDLMLQKQAARTPEEVARIKQEQHLNVWLFKNALGPWFTEKNLPLTTKLLHNVDMNQRPVVDAAKSYWNRPRPPLQDKRIHPPIGLPPNGSYPSGHSTFDDLNALVLAQLVPDLKAAIMARGQQIGDDRVIAGVYFPSDVNAGRTLAYDLLAKLVACPAFQADFAHAKAEIAAARLKP